MSKLVLRECVGAEVSIKMIDDSVIYLKYVNEDTIVRDTIEERLTNGCIMNLVERISVKFTSHANSPESINGILRLISCGEKSISSVGIRKKFLTLGDDNIYAIYEIKGSMIGMKIIKDEGQGYCVYKFEFQYDDFDCTLVNVDCACEEGDEINDENKL